MNMQELLAVQHRLSALEQRVSELEAEKLKGDPDEVAQVLERRRGRPPKAPEAA